eukprot:68561_1
MTTQQVAFNRINAALRPYYKRNGYHYKDQFIEDIKEDELDDPEIPIEKELGDGVDPRDCVYCWTDNMKQLPIPSYVRISQRNKELFVFYVLTHCWIFGEPPSDEWIISFIIPNSGASMNIQISVFCNKICTHISNIGVVGKYNYAPI